MPESLTIRPDPALWPSLIRHNASPRADQFRREMGLPTGRPLIMTGHQAGFWHPGILAKYLAADAAAERAGADVAWIVVDQDRAGSTAVRYPVVGETGTIGARATQLSRDTAVPAGAPGSTDEGLRLMTGALRKHADEPVFARAVGAATSDLVRPLLGHAPSPPTIFATELHRATLFSELVARMAREPEACCRAYNAAVARHAGAGVRPLVADEVQDRWELPLWRLPHGKPRAHVYAEDVAGIPAAELAPKALLMTGLLRLAGCDLFIHGTGGGGGDEGSDGYDHITEEWLATWLGIEPSSLAPITVVTATRYLPLGVPPPPGPGALARAVWLAHAAPHNPHIIRDGYFDDAKRRLVLEIAAAEHAGRAPLYRTMHTLLAEYRRAHAADLAALRDEAVRARERAASGPLFSDRTWPFPLYPERILIGLRDQIRAAFGIGGR